MGGSRCRDGHGQEEVPLGRAGRRPVVVVVVEQPGTLVMEQQGAVAGVVLK